MELATALWLGIGLFLVILVPYLVLEIHKGKARGHTWFTWIKPRGHSDTGPIDEVERRTMEGAPGVRR